MNKLGLFSIIFLLLSCSTKKVDLSHQEMGTLWLQTSGEARALIYQTFNLAKLRVDQELKKTSKKKRAIIVDADETLVDNSPYQAKNIKDGRVYTSSNWGEWIAKADAKALPGAVEFLNYAKKKGIAIFFVTNRKMRGYDATLKNFKELGFPVTRKNLLLREGNDSSKKTRRDGIAKDHNIFLFIGDSLGDFADFFEHKPFDQRNALVDKHREEFGRKFLVLPNPMYGDWVQSVYDYDYKKTEAQKKALRRSRLYSY